MAYIEFRDVVKRFGDNTVLDHINFGIQQGDLVTLLGPSGCGKSTLLRCLSGLESVSEGQIVLDGRDVTNVPASKRNIGMVFQQYSLFPNMTVEQNVAFGLKMKKVPKDQIEKKVADAIEMVELKGKERAYPANLSGGQQQRAALARSIVTEPSVLLLDEPLSAIDAKLRKALQSRIREIHKELGLTTIFVTHDQDEAMVMSDVIQLFHSGRIEQAGSPVEVYTEPRLGVRRELHRELQPARVPASSPAVTGVMPCPAGNVVAIRPETIGISLGERPRHTEGAYVVRGTVQSTAPRAATSCATPSTIGPRPRLRVDVLFRSFHMFDDLDDRLPHPPRARLPLPSPPRAPRSTGAAGESDSVRSCPSGVQRGQALFARPEAACKSASLPGARLPFAPPTARSAPCPSADQVFLAPGRQPLQGQPAQPHHQLRRPSRSRGSPSPAFRAHGYVVSLPLRARPLHRPTRDAYRSTRASSSSPALRPRPTCTQMSPRPCSLRCHHMHGILGHRARWSARRRERFSPHGAPRADPLPRELGRRRRGTASWRERLRRARLRRHLQPPHLEPRGAG